MSKDQERKIFYQGYMCALAIVQKQHTADSIVYDAFKENPLSIDEMKSFGIDEGDIQTLRPIVEEYEHKNPTP